MNAQNETLVETFLLIFEALKVSLSQGKEAAAEFISSKVFPSLKAYGLKLGKLTLLTFIPSCLFTIIGFSLNSKWIIATGGLWRAVCTVLLFILAAPIGIALERLSEGEGGFSESMRRYILRVKSIYLGELLITLFLLIFLEPLRNNLPILPVLLVLFLTLCALGSPLLSPKILKPLLGAIFVVVIFTLLFPKTFGWFWEETQKIAATPTYPKLLQPTLKDLTEQKIAFFNPATGNPEIWYSIEKSKIRIFKGPGYDSDNQKILQPITYDIKELYCKQVKEETPEPEIKNTPPKAFSDLPTPAVQEAEILKQSTSTSVTSLTTSAVIQPTQNLPNHSNVVFVNPQEKARVAILIIDSSSQVVINTDELVRELRSKKNIHATNALLTKRFITDGYFEKAFQGEGIGITQLNLSGQAQYLILGKKHKPTLNPHPLSDKLDVVSAKVVIEYCIISTATGAIRQFSSVEGDSPAFSYNRAELLATSVALSLLRETIPDYLM